MDLRRRSSGLLLALVLGLLSPAMAEAIVIQFDYRYATGTFIDDPAVQALLDQAAAEFTPFTDNLLQIDEAEFGPPNTWSARFTNPTTGALEVLPSLVVPTDTLIVFVGARELGGSTAGEGGPGGFSAGGFTPWFDRIDYRGQAGEAAAPATDFGPWGGMVSFDTTTNWNLTSGLPGFSEVDFLSVAVHELGHVLGYGTSDSWDALINFGSDTFTGTESVNVYGSEVPLDVATGHGHWADSGITPEPAMDPVITTGFRKLLTALDYAGFADIGWEVPVALLVPEPDTGVLVGMGLVLLVGWVTTRRPEPTRHAARPRRPPGARARPRAPRRSRGSARARG